MRFTTVTLALFAAAASARFTHERPQVLPRLDDSTAMSGPSTDGKDGKDSAPVSIQAHSGPSNTKDSKPASVQSPPGPSTPSTKSSKDSKPDSNQAPSGSPTTTKSSKDSKPDSNQAPSGSPTTSTKSSKDSKPDSNQAPSGSPTTSTMSTKDSKPDSIQAPSGSLADISQPGLTQAPSGPSTTLTVFQTTVRTVTSCAPTITNCPANSGNVAVVTDTITLSTTVCPVAQASSISAAIVASHSASMKRGKTSKTGKASKPVSTSAFSMQAPSGPSTTLTVFQTTVRTITSCAPTVTNCPAKSGSPAVVTDTITLSTTVCPVAQASAISSAIVASYSASMNGGNTKPPVTTQAPSGPSTTLTVFHTTVRTITSCAPTVTNCPAKSGSPAVVTDTIILSTTVCPVAQASAISSAIVASHSASKHGHKHTVKQTSIAAVYSTIPQAGAGGCPAQNCAAPVTTTVNNCAATVTVTVTQAAVTMTMAADNVYAVKPAGGDSITTSAPLPSSTLVKSSHHDKNGNKSYSKKSSHTKLHSSLSASSTSKPGKIEMAKPSSYN